MKITEESLRAEYRTLSSDYLVRRLGDGTLTEMATRVAEQELSSRGLTAEQRQAMEQAARQQRAAVDDGRLATPPSRFVSQSIDGLVALGLLLIPTFAGGNNEILGALGIAGFVGYLLLADALPRGQSLGKRAMGTAVVDSRTGRPCGIGQSVLRNFLGILGIIDWIFIFGRMRQRLGDMAAGTLVVHRPKPTERAADPTA